MQKPLLALFVVLALGTTLVLLLRGGREAASTAVREIKPSAERPIGGPAAGALGDAAPEIAPAARETVGGARDAPQAMPAPPRHDTGTVALRLVDAQTDEPLGDHPYFFYGEASGQHLLAEGSTDANGRAHVPDLLADNVAVLRTARVPPYAPRPRGRSGCGGSRPKPSSCAWGAAGA